MTDKIIDEIKAAAREMALEFSQSQWEDALIHGFRCDYTMGGVIARAAGVNDLTAAEWDQIIERASKLKPSFSIYSSRKQTARVWIAQHARIARDALWDADYEKAKRLLRKGGREKSALIAVKNECKKSRAEDMKGRIYLNAKERDKRTDWKTCK